jgi:arabinan endo-1,5-alpha-L-arabinosidase
MRRLISILAIACAAAVPAVAAEFSASGSASRVPDQPALRIIHDGYPDPQPASGADLVAHDPSMVRGADGRWYVFSTHDGVQVRVSADLRHFTRVGPAFPHGTALAAQYAGDPMEIWAPDVSRRGETYWMYYAVSQFGSNNSAIGVATSRTAAPGTWTDRGLVYATKSGDAINAIDPNLFVDHSGRWWLTFGSFWSGIAQLPLDPRTGKPAEGTPTPRVIASRPDHPTHAVEAPSLVEHAGWYYLFVSFDYCCRGMESSYRIMVGRSRAPSGPFVDRSGRPMLDGGGTQVLGTHDQIIGPGGQSVVPGRSGWQLVYHYYDGTNAGTPHLALNDLVFDRAGWPHAA